jgi:hypothetical protein
MSDLSEHEVQTLLQNLQTDLDAFPAGMNSLEYELESAAKHIPAYLKIVKGHIEQLRTVLELENHNHRTLENAGLATPVQQLIKLFNTLKDDDIQLLEDLAIAARNWQPEFAGSTLQETNKETTLLESAETTSY